MTTPVNNPDIRGEGKRVYYQVGEYDTTQTEATILGDAAWIQLCQVEVNETNSRELEATEDACSGDEIGYTAGRRESGFTLTLNEFRLLNASVRAFDDFAEADGIVAFLVLDSDLADPGTRGRVMNGLIGQNDKNGPQKGVSTRSLEIKPAARTEFRSRRVYGADVA